MKHLYSIDFRFCTMIFFTNLANICALNFKLTTEMKTQRLLFIIPVVVSREREAAVKKY